MHFPPCSEVFKDPEQSFAEDDFFALIEESGIINKIVFGHIHRDQMFKINLYLKISGIELYSVAIDYHDWQPVHIL
jgi:predicted phosphohydrolase